MSLNFVIFLSIVLVVLLLCMFVVNPIARKIAEKTPNKFDDLLVEKRFFSRALQLVPATIFSAAFARLWNSSPLCTIFVPVFLQYGLP